jgi:hypothetical protein
MKRIYSAIVMSLMAATLWAAPIDGKWRAETKRADRMIATTFDLKAADGKLTGTVSMGRGKRDKSIEIQNGKIDGDRFSFTTLHKTKKGERSITWQGAVSGDELKGTTGRGKRAIEFTAKRVS